jgi:hypothetical protein
VTVQDKTAPIVTVHQPVPVEATSPDGAVVEWEAPTATDDIEGALSKVSCDHGSGEVFPVGDTSVECTATDSHNNTGSASFTVTVKDTTAPKITVPSNITAEATSPNGAVVTYLASASDIVDGEVAVDCSPASGTQFPLDLKTTVACTATDEHGNGATTSFTIDVVDTTAPTMPALTDVVAEATSPDGAVVSYAAGKASDVVDHEVVPVCTPASGSTFRLGDTTVKCTATDAHGNAASGTFTVTVQDTTAPEFGPISVPTKEAEAPQGAQVSFDPSATDVVDPSPVISCDPQSGSWFPLGATQVACTATDSSGNVGRTVFTVNVADTTDPVVSAGVNQTVEATSAEGALVSWNALTAHDTVSGDLPVTCDPASESTFPLGATVVTCTATDGSSNEGAASFTITVQDKTPPAFGSMPNVSATATSAAGATVTYTLPTASDLVSGSTEVTCERPSGSVFPLGTTMVLCSSTDAAGNTAIKSFTVSVAVSWGGVLAPVTNGGTYKLGSTIPVKFMLTGASAGITNLEATLWVRKTPAASTSGAATAVSTSAATTGNLFRYTDGQYMFNLNTKPLTVGTYELRIDLGDGIERTVPITLR